MNSSYMGMGAGATYAPILPAGMMNAIAQQNALAAQARPLSSQQAPAVGGVSRPRAGTSLSYDTNQSLSGLPGLGQTYATIAGMNPTVTQTNRTQQTPSPALQQNIDRFQNTLQNLSQNMQGAYSAKQGTYGDLINILGNLYGAQGSNAMGAAQTSALGSGLTPLAAQGAGQSAMQQMLAQYFPALAGLRGEQADVGINAQNAQGQIQQNLNLPFMSQVLSPYYQGVAGQTQTGQTTDPTKLAGLLAGLSQSGMSANLNYQQLNDALQIAQINAAVQQQGNLLQNQVGMAGVGMQGQIAGGRLGLDYQQLAQNQQQFGQTLGLNYGQLAQRQQEAQQNYQVGMGGVGAQQGQLALAQQGQNYYQGVQFPQEQNTAQQNMQAQLWGGLVRQLDPSTIQRMLGIPGPNTSTAGATAQSSLEDRFLTQGTPENAALLAWMNR
mgnify:CR=1 FL=1